MATTVENPFDTTQSSTSGIVNKAIGADIGNTVAQYTPQTRSVDPKTQTSAGQVESMLANDSPLLQRARTIAKQGMAQRGLVNSSMAQGAGAAAMIDRVTPLAQQDASIYNSTASENMAAKNNAGMFNAGQQNQFGIQKNAQDFSKTEREASQQFSSGEREASQKFSSGEREATQKFSTGEREASQKFSSGERVASQNFTADESALGRAQQAWIQENQQKFTSAQAELDRAQQTAMTDKSIKAQTDLQTAQQNFSKAQAELDRSQQRTLQDDQQLFQAEQTKTAQTFQENQAKLDRTQQIDLANINVKAQQAQIPANFAASVSNTAMTGVNAIMADANLSAAVDNIAPAGSSPKTRAINNVVAYANAQIDWAKKFYGTEIPKITTPT